jgi:putative SOS response-associated peptidase YedK
VSTEQHEIPGGRSGRLPPSAKLSLTNEPVASDYVRSIHHNPARQGRIGGYALGVPEGELGDYAPRYNIAPTQPYFVLTAKYESRKAIAATWGLVNTWAKDASRAAMCINAKAETVDSLPSFREAFEKLRCVVPADGFY